MLANKYRPQKFSDFVGQNMIINLICQSIQQNKVSQSILLSGMHGVGKTSLARIIAKSVNCVQRNQEQEPCNQCENCKLITHSTHPDIIEIDAASHTSVDNMRQIISNSQYLPIKTKYKINIIDEAHMLSDSAFNSLLKTLEEPNKNVIFILATTRPEKIPATIISRCQRYVFSNFNEEEIVAHLKTLLQQEKVKYDIPAIQKIARAAQGSMRNAIFYLEQSLYLHSDYITDHNIQDMLHMQHNQNVLQLLQEIITGQKIPALHSMKALNYKSQPRSIINELLKMIHQIIVIAYIATEHIHEYQHDFSKEHYETLVSLSKKINPLTGHRLWCIAWKHLHNLNYQILPQAILEIMVIEMIYSLHMPSAHNLARQIIQTHDDNKVNTIVPSSMPGTQSSAVTQSNNNTNNTSIQNNKISQTNRDLNNIKDSNNIKEKSDSQIDIIDTGKNNQILSKCDKIKSSNKILQDINQDFPQAKIEIHKKTTV